MFDFWNVISGAMAAIISVVYAYKYNNIKSLKNTIAILRNENESLNNLIEVKEKTITDFKMAVERLETKLNRQAILTDGKLLEISRKIEQLEEKNRLYQIEITQQQISNKELKEALALAVEHCDKDNCPMCKSIGLMLLKH